MHIAEKSLSCLPMKTEELRKWLKENGRNRAWLAAQCGLSKHTVDGWFGGRPIPGAAMTVIRSLVSAPPTITTPLTLEVWKDAQDAANREGVSIDEFIINAIKAASKPVIIALLLLHLWRTDLGTSKHAWTAAEAKQTALLAWAKTKAFVARP